MPITEVNNVKIAYDIYGEGEPLILIHGYSYNKSVWIAQIDALSKNFKLITLDLRGSGESSHPEDPYTMDTLVEDLKGFMNVLKIEKAHLMGWSLGGMIIQNFVLKYPERANKLILIATHAGGSDLPGGNFLRDSIIDIYELRKTDPRLAFFKLARLIHSTKFRKKLEKNIEEKIHELVTLEELIKDFIGNQANPLDLKYLADLKHDTLNRLDEIKNNTLILAGAKDRLISVLMAEQMNDKMSNSSLEVIESAGHMLFFEEAPKVNQIIIDFLKN